jgi:hypothetical protein
MVCHLTSRSFFTFPSFIFKTGVLAVSSNYDFIRINYADFFTQEGAKFPIAGTIFSKSE